MTKLQEQAFAMLERMPADAQDGIARALLRLDQVFGLDDVEPEHRTAVDEETAQRPLFNAGRKTRRGVRRFALPRYPYLVFHGLDEATETIVVVTIRHGRVERARFGRPVSPRRWVAASLRSTLHPPGPTFVR